MIANCKRRTKVLCTWQWYYPLPQSTIQLQKSNSPITVLTIIQNHAPRGRPRPKANNL